MVTLLTTIPTICSCRLLLIVQFLLYTKAESSMDIYKSGKITRVKDILTVHNYLQWMDT